MLIQPRTLLCCLILLCSCHQSTILKDAQIDQAMKSGIDQLNAQLIQSLAAGDYGQSSFIFSDKLKESGKGGHFDSLFSRLKGRVGLPKFHSRNQFYIRNSSDEKEVVVMSGLSGDHDYSLHFKSINKETFVTTGYFEDSLQSLALVTIYGKYGNAWKLNIFQIGSLGIMGRDAFDWYQRAADNYKKGFVVDAANELDLCQQIIEPGNKIWHYQKEKEMMELSQRVVLDINKSYTFPLTVQEVPSKPVIYQEFPLVTSQGYYPAIFYTTHLSMSDTAALRKECDALHRVIGTLFHGLDSNHAHIFYKVFQRNPTSHDAGLTREFIRDNK